MTDPHGLPLNRAGFAQALQDMYEDPLRLSEGHVFKQDDPIARAAWRAATLAACHYLQDAAIVVTGRGTAERNAGRGTGAPIVDDSFAAMLGDGCRRRGATRVTK